MRFPFARGHQALRLPESPDTHKNFLPLRGPPLALVTESLKLARLRTVLRLRAAPVGQAFSLCPVSIPSGWNVGLPLIRCSGQGPHLAMTGEPRGFSRVAAGFSSYDGNSGFLLCWAREVQSSIRVHSSIIHSSLIVCISHLQIDRNSEHLPWTHLLSYPLGRLCPSPQ